MRRCKNYPKKWPYIFTLILCSALLGQILLKFDILITWLVTFIAIIVFIKLGETVLVCTQGKEIGEIHLLWGVITITVLTAGIFFIQQGAYISDISYGKWFSQLLHQHSSYIEYEIGTLILVDYIIFLCIYGKTAWQIAKENIREWIPSFWYVVGGIGLVLYIREGDNHTTRSMILLGVGVLLVSYLLLTYIIKKEHKIIYHMSAKRYLVSFVICLSITLGIGMNIPQYSELPGARWMRKVVRNFTGNVTLQSKVPRAIRLDNEFEISDAVLFEVSASEPLYLRDIAYSHYENGEWSIPTKDEVLDSYIILKPQYLYAEYSQIKSLLDEIAYQNSKDQHILPKYTELANYEASISHKKQYTIIQNPINKVNYFTVNGVTNIKDEQSPNIYYYQNINNCYFHGEQLVEPGQYTIEYYDHIPRQGSREYMFLRNMNVMTWKSIYKKIANNRIEYGYYFDELPKILLTYTPSVQYNNAKKNFSQVPEELKEPLRALTKTITFSNHSDWFNAEAICNYLKNQYTYRLHSKSIGENDRIYEFLFEKKEGICQEFASSMVLMCRSIGIPAKYVTGYLVSEKSEETGRYIVREKDAHAFVEVYIAGYGWMTFDPTPEMLVEEVVVDEEEWKSLDVLRIGGIILTFIILFFFLKGGFIRLKEIGYLMSWRFAKTPRQIENLMRHTSWLLDYMENGRRQHETLSEYAIRLKEEDIDILKIVKLYEDYKYGNRLANLEEIKQGYKDYKKLKLKLKNK
ncbi:MAG: hypothetical protein E7231_13555 [Cellulosilyticum sp.]|nr:hypothetical protein [Cellulosilyticum sp.]